MMIEPILILVEESEPIFRRILNMSITGGYVILAVMLIRLLLKKAPKRWSYLLWSAAAFRLVCPVSFESLFSLFSLKPFDMSAAQEIAPSTLTYIPENIGLMAEPEVTVGIPYLNSAISGSLPAATPMYSANPLQIWMYILTFFWICGMAALVIYSIVSLILLLVKLQKAVKIEDRIYCSEEVRSPFVLGIIKPRIYLPYGLDDDARHYVLTHERIHIKRCDHIIKPLAYLILVLHWFNPLCWLAFILMSRDMEMSCDERVLAQDESIRKAYGITLLSFAANKRFPAPAPLAFGESAVKVRIKNILSWKKPTLWVTAIAILLCAAAIIACAANPKKDKTSDSVILNRDGLYYHVRDVLYDAPMYSFTVTTENAPEFMLDGGKLYTRHLQEGGVYGDWLECGELAEMTLTEENFDDMFLMLDENNYKNFDPAALRSQVKWANYVEDINPDNDVCYYLIQAEGGKLYLAYGYNSSNNERENIIRWMFELEGRSEAYLQSDEPVGYISDQCIYMTPLSSTLSTGDSGMLYYFSADEFEIMHSSGEIVAAGEMSGVWSPWPYSESELDQLLTGSLGNHLNLDFYSKKFEMRLNDNFSLWEINGSMWIVRFSGQDEKRMIWDIYSLIPEATVDKVYWEYAPNISAKSPFFRFKFDFDYDELSVSCTLGNMGQDAIGPKHQVAQMTIDDTSAKWYPFNYGEVASVSGSMLTYTAVKNGEYVASGSIYIRDTGEIRTGIGKIYSAYMISDDCIMQSNSEIGGAVITRPVQEVPAAN